MERPLAIDLFCGLGGWTEGLLAEGYYVVGFDIEKHQYGEHRYPAQLVLQDVRTIHGSKFKDAALIVGSPPCQAYSWRAMPWKAARSAPPPDNTLFESCFRIQREASEAAGRHVPMVVENVCGAQKWVGRARWHYGSYHLWGDVPALMPMTKSLKVPGFRFDGSAFNDTAIKNLGGSWFNVAHNTTSGKGRNPDGRKGGGGTWFHEYGPGQGTRNTSSKSVKRKMAAAMIAKIPYELARHIAHVYHPARVAA